MDYVAWPRPGGSFARRTSTARPSELNEREGVPRKEKSPAPGCETTDLKVSAGAAPAGRRADERDTTPQPVSWAVGTRAEGDPSLRTETLTTSQRISSWRASWGGRGAGGPSRRLGGRGGVGHFALAVASLARPACGPRGGMRHDRRGSRCLTASRVGDAGRSRRGRTAGRCGIETCPGGEGRGPRGRGQEGGSLWPYPAFSGALGRAEGTSRAARACQLYGRRPFPCPPGQRKGAVPHLATRTDRVLKRHSEPGHFISFFSSPSLTLTVLPTSSATFPPFPDQPRNP